jgi:hypothetical protein
MIDVAILDVQPHPDQATTHPGIWAIQLRVSHADKSRTFWRWWFAQRSSIKPSIEEIIPWFWNDTFSNLHGFNFERDVLAGEAP